MFICLMLFKLYKYIILRVLMLLKYVFINIDYDFTFILYMITIK